MSVSFSACSNVVSAADQEHAGVINMKLKFKDFKIDFSKKDSISLVCFTIVMVLVLVLGNCFGFVHAEGSQVDLFLNWQDYQSSNVYNSYYFNVTYINSSENSVLASNALFDLDFSTIETVPSGFDFDDINYYCIVGNGYPSHWRVYLFHCDNVPIYHCGENNSSNFYIDNLDNSTVYYMDVSPHGDGTDLSSPYVFIPDGISSSNATFDNEGDCYYFLTESHSGDYKLVGSNFPYVTYNSQANFTNGSYHGDLVAYMNGSSLDSLNLHDVNYLNVNGSCPSLNGFSNLENVGGGSGTGETSLNNLYMNNPFWTFSMPSYNSSNRGNIVNNNGTATFNATKTNYQLEHGSQFNLHFTFQITVKYTADGGWSGGSHGFYLLGATPYNALGSDTVSRTGTFKYRPSGGSSTYSELSLEHFNGSYSFNTITNYRYIFANCYLDGDTSKDDFLTWYSRSYSSDSVQFSSIVLKCTAELFDSNQNYSSPCIYQYDFVSGTASMLSDGMGTNNNPYDYENQDSYTDSVTGAYGYVTQTNNNNQSVTITNSNVNTNDISNVIGDIGDEDDSSSLISKFSSLLSLSSWIAVFASALSFVPVAFWTNLVSYFAVALGILSTFLVLRYILNLLT